ncbi:MAG: hypothetical protein D6771_04085, partial [Zetaproteobacteria bacterium]
MMKALRITGEHAATALQDKRQVHPGFAALLAREDWLFLALEIAPKTHFKGQPTSRLQTVIPAN